MIQIEKLLSMVLALGAIQIIGTLASRWLGLRMGVLISGFVGGIISSTAFTAALSRKSKDSTVSHVQLEATSFLSATLAMLLQGLFLVFMGFSDPPFSVVILFISPVVFTVILILIRYRKTESIKVKLPESSFTESFISILKLTIFIIGVLTISKVLQNYFGEKGLEVLTFLVSLFEIHGSIIANTQMIMQKTISLDEYCLLITLSIVASYVSKVVIVLALGHPFLKKRVLIWSSLLATVVFLTLGFVLSQ